MQPFMHFVDTNVGFLVIFYVGLLKVIAVVEVDLLAVVVDFGFLEVVVDRLLEIVVDVGLL